MYIVICYHFYKHCILLFVITSEAFTSLNLLSAVVQKRFMMLQINNDLLTQRCIDCSFVYFDIIYVAVA